MAKADLSADTARTLISYDPLTGAFVWKVRMGGRGLAGASAGAIGPGGYISINMRRCSYKAHRLAWLLMTGEWPSGEVDHINGDPADNRWANLRLTTRATNMQNQRRAHARKNSTGLLGVSRRPTYFEARIQVNKCLHSIGKYATAEEAHAAYVEAKRRMHSTCAI